MFWCAVAAHAGGITVGNSSFETPSGCQACYDPGGATWGFTGTAGILGDGNLEVATPFGAQTGWLQYLGNAQTPVISQTLTGFTVGDSYVVSFYLAERVSGAVTLPVIVTMGANNLGEYTPNTTSWTDNVITSSFVASGTSYTLSFSGDISFPGFTPYTIEGDANIDSVAVNDLGVVSSTPEPASFLLAGSALALVVVRYFTSRKEQRTRAVSEGYTQTESAPTA